MLLKQRSENATEKLNIVISTPEPTVLPFLSAYFVLIESQILHILIDHLFQSGSQHGWQGQTFVYERTRIDRVILDPTKGYEYDSDDGGLLMDEQGHSHGAHENSDAHIEGMDRIERYLR